MRKIYYIVILLSIGGLLSGCSKWTTSNADLNPRLAKSKRATKNPEQIKITQNDITNRPYKNLGDIEVTVNKTTIFHSDPSRKDIDVALKKKAAEIGADAVVLVRYGTVGVSGFSWGSLNGKGRAIVFK